MVYLFKLVSQVQQYRTEHLSVIYKVLNVAEQIDICYNNNHWPGQTREKPTHAFRPTFLVLPRLKCLNKIETKYHPWLTFLRVPDPMQDSVIFYPFAWLQWTASKLSLQTVYWCHRYHQVTIPSANTITQIYSKANHWLKNNNDKPEYCNFDQPIQLSKCY